jgi:uncharacterized protein YjbI with pentapeptide repeats
VLEGARFSEARLRRADFENADLYWAIFFRADLRFANLRCASLNGADLSEADLSNADLTFADLSCDQMNGATDLTGANLLNACLHDAKLVGAIYDSRTRFPIGFDPSRSGMRKIE